MRLLSVNVGLPRSVIWDGEPVETAIFKEPVTGAVAVGRTNLAGDRQADLAVHGGVDKAVYVYPSEHYPVWRAELELAQTPWGMFGENFTVEGALEGAVRVGDRFAVGTAEFEVSQPRTPCHKLGLRFARSDMVKRFLLSGRLGFYLRVLREGTVEAGQPVRSLSSDPDAPSIAELARLEVTGRDDVAVLERAVRTAALSASWRERYRTILERLHR